MFKDHESSNNLEIFDISDNDILSLGSSESGSETEAGIEEDNKVTSKQAIHINTQEISYHVLRQSEKSENMENADNMYGSPDGEVKQKELINNTKFQYRNFNQQNKNINKE